MKQKIVMRIQIPGNKCPKRALQITATVHGVESLALQGQLKDRVVVVGNDIDIVELVRKLREKVGSTEIISISEIN